MSDEQIKDVLRHLFEGDAFVILAKATMVAVLVRVAAPLVMYLKGKSNGGTFQDKFLSKMDHMITYQKRQARMTRSLRDEAREAHGSQAKATEALAEAARHNNEIAAKLLRFVESPQRHRDE